ncbi:MAG: hypothetical protein HDT36_02120 [Clostridiales bacterium]|nr:hypothetical protein [Clostridiales bacterium]
MDNKELDEILQEYARSTQMDKEIAFKKLNEKPQPEKRPKKRFKPQYVLSIVAVFVIAVVLCTVLPLTLTNDSASTNEAPIYCGSGDIVYKLEEDFSELKNKCGIDAYYPNKEFGDVTYYSISSKTDNSFAGARIEYSVFDEYVVFIELVIIPKNYILEDYEHYFDLEDEQKWREYDLKYSKEDCNDMLFYGMQIYFTDGKYDYFLDVNSDGNLGAAELLNMIYD